VSRRNAALIPHPDGLLLEPIGQATVLVNGERIEQPVIVTARDRVTLGRVDFLIEDVNSRKVDSSGTQGSSPVDAELPEPVRRLSSTQLISRDWAIVASSGLGVAELSMRSGVRTEEIETCEIVAKAVGEGRSVSNSALDGAAEAVQVLRRALEADVLSADVR
jgi:hypothetical protein